MIEKAMKGIKNPALVLVHMCQRWPLRAISDRTYINLFYYAYQGIFPNLNNPEGFNEKLQWLKLHTYNEFYTNLTDKYLVKNYVAKILGDQHVIPTLAVWDRVEDIDAQKLPESFVLKCNHDSGSVVVCKDIKNFDIDSAKKKLGKALKRNYFWKSREPNYRKIKPKVIAEQYVEDVGKNELTDYKFFCFDGVARFVQVDSGRFSQHIRNFYTTDWEFIDVEYGCANDKRLVQDPPIHFREMLDMAEMLSEGIPHVRVDFYDTGAQVFFGEMTFHHGGGVMDITPPFYDRLWGSYLSLPTTQENSGSQSR
ncbi:ATP-grasp fold amidoligase family protein [Adlercreutzia sp. ZJ141]|uniref:ATP-grasp fold amidoligase family protein n=1 Tax=Adlercreutzia sp. ZJ141 TaxID=2709406 RepID=UPI0013EB9895|nr:ATP-grasp fold amidoligase family protein [Adlercreutzia sp. ZJ141]